MTWYEKIIQAHLRVTDAVSHCERIQSDRYFVWQEEAEQSLKADNRHVERTVQGTTDLFTKREFDPWKHDIEFSFTRSGIAWELNSVQFEEDTGFLHYEWVWNVTGSDA